MRLLGTWKFEWPWEFSLMDLHEHEFNNVQPPLLNQWIDELFGTFKLLKRSYKDSYSNIKQPWHKTWKIDCIWTIFQFPSPTSLFTWTKIDLEPLCAYNLKFFMCVQSFAMYSWLKLWWKSLQSIGYWMIPTTITLKVPTSRSCFHTRSCNLQWHHFALWLNTPLLILVQCVSPPQINPKV
jgi:hypothetical protein